MQIHEVVDKLRRTMTDTDVGCFSFVKRAGCWGVSVDGDGLVSLTLNDKPRSDLMNRYVFRMTGEYGLKLEAVSVVRDPWKLRGWLKEVGDIYAPVGGTRGVTAPGPVGRIRYGTPLRVFSPDLAMQPAVDGETVREIAKEIEGAQWSTTQDVILETGPPAVTFDVLRCPAWCRREFGATPGDWGLWGGVRNVLSAVRAGNKRNLLPDAIVWARDYLADCAPAMHFAPVQLQIMRARMVEYMTTAIERCEATGEGLYPWVI